MLLMSSKILPITHKMSRSVPLPNISPLPFLLFRIGIHQRADHALVGTRRCRAARLKNATERCDRLSVTFTLSSRSTSLSGDGKKSSTILTRPISPLPYLTVGFFIDCLSFPPVAGPENPDLFVSPREAHRHNSALNPAETEVALLAPAMIEVFSDHAKRVQKRVLGKLEPDAHAWPD